MATMTPADLCQIEEIKQLKARYFRFIDTKQWSNLRELFTADASYEGFGEGKLTGADPFVARLKGRLDSARVIHHGHSPEIRILKPDTARGIWTQFDFIEFSEPATDGPQAGQRGRLGFGHYEDEYRKVGDVWRISFMRIRRLRVDPLFGKSAFYDLVPPTLRSGASDWLSPSTA
jgi:hypothetical protein